MVIIDDTFGVLRNASCPSSDLYIHNLSPGFPTRTTIQHSTPLHHNYLVPYPNPTSLPSHSCELLGPRLRDGLASTLELPLFVPYPESSLPRECML